MCWITNIIKIINNKFNLIFMSDRCCKCLYLQPFYLVSFPITYTFNYCIQIFLVLRGNFWWYSIPILPFLACIKFIISLLWLSWFYFSINIKILVILLLLLIIILLSIIFFLYKSNVSHFLNRLIVYHYLLWAVLHFFSFFNCFLTFKYWAVLCFIHSNLLL